VADLVYHFSNAPKSKEIGGWCFASKQHLANCLGVSKSTVNRAIRKLIEIKLIERDEKTDFLKADKWYNEVISYKSKILN